MRAVDETWLLDRLVSLVRGRSLGPPERVRAADLEGRPSRRLVPRLLRTHHGGSSRLNHPASGQPTSTTSIGKRHLDRQVAPRPPGTWPKVPRVSNTPFSPQRRRSDVIAALPAIGMIVGAVLGAVMGFLNPDASPVLFGGIGIAVGLVLGLFLREVFSEDDEE